MSLALCVAVGLAVPKVLAGDLDPRGIYFHAWTGSSAGTEFAMVLAEGPGRYRFADVFGNGFLFALDADGSFRLVGANEAGGGRFEGADRGSLDWSKWGMSFSGFFHRVARTAPDFPLTLAAPQEGPAGLSGPYEASVESFGVVSGARRAGSKGRAQVDVRGQTLRLTLPDGTWHQGVFQSDRRIVFRVAEPPPSDPRYRTPPGAATSVAMDEFGLGIVQGDRELEFLLLLQTRSPVGDQKQEAIQIRLVR